MESPFSEDEFKSMKQSDLENKLFDAALTLFKRRMERMAQVAYPVIKQVFENQGAMYENILIPITDGKRMYNISCNLKEAYESECKAINKHSRKHHPPYDVMKLERTSAVRWRVYVIQFRMPATKNKDPLLLQIEAYNLFKNMIIR